MDAFDYPWQLTSQLVVARKKAAEQAELSKG
jgi:hypothetical protein